MKRLISLVIILLITILGAVAYEVYDYAHSTEPSPFAVTKKNGQSTYVMFTCTKSGFAGHAYIDFSSPGTNKQDRPFGQAPAEGVKTIKAAISTVFPVSGDVNKQKYFKPDPTYNSTLVVWVNADQEERLLAVCKKWDKKDYRLGISDCVAFSEALADTIHLNLPFRLMCLTPRAYITQLILKNEKLLEIKLNLRD